MYHACAAREVTPGSAWNLANEYMDALKDPRLKINPGRIQALLKQAVERFNAPAGSRRQYPGGGDRG